MGIYEAFAEFYVKGLYPSYSKQMAELLPAVLERFDVRPHTLLDLACGEGTFAVEMAKRGYRVTGVDLAPEMLRFARKRAKGEHIKAVFVQGDMRDLAFNEEFDLVTCWYDSMNYLLELEDLKRTFKGVYRALRPGGLFIFDMNTIYGLAVRWQRQPCYIQQDTPGLLEIHCASYDYEKNIATLRITGFRREGELWLRMDEEHKERGYTLEQIKEALKQANLCELACWGNLKEMSEPNPDSGRVWFVTKKGEI